MSQVIPGNRLQARIQKANNAARAPHPDQVLRAYGRIAVVYDVTFLRDNDPPPRRVSQLLKLRPGELIFGIEVEGVRDLLYLTTGQSEDMIKSVFGNSPLLIGRTVEITYRHGGIRTGKITIMSKLNGKRTDLQTKTDVPDIGSII